MLPAWLGSGSSFSLVCTHTHVGLRRHCVPNQQSVGLPAWAGPYGAAHLLNNLCALNVCLPRLAAIACHGIGRAKMANTQLRAATLPDQSLFNYSFVLLCSNNLPFSTERKALHVQYRQPVQDSTHGRPLLHGDCDSLMPRSFDCNQ